MIKLNLIKVMADKKAPGRTKRTPAPKQAEAPERFELGDDKDAEIEKLKVQLKKAEKTGKVVEVKTDTPKEVKIRPSKARKQTHTVYVTKKIGDAWGNEQTREMSEQAYNAIAKDISLKVTLPANSRLVEPELKGCKDC